MKCYAMCVKVLCGTLLHDVALRGAVWRDNERQTIRFVMLRNAVLYGAMLCGATRRDAVLYGAALRVVVLRDATLRCA